MVYIDKVRILTGNENNHRRIFDFFAIKMSDQVKDITCHEIHSAAYYGNIGTIKQLIQSGQDINCRNKKGDTPLMMALLGPADKKTKGEILNFLLNNAADVNVVNHNGDPTLHIAVKASCKKMISRKFVETLLDHGTDNTLVNKCGQTASEIAFQLGNGKLGNLLLFYGRRTNTVSFYSNKGAYERLTSRNTHREKVSGQNKTHGLMWSLFSCIFPTIAFHRQLQEDLSEIERKRKTMISSCERSVQRENTVKHIQRCNGSVTIKGKNGDVIFHQHLNESKSGIVKVQVHVNENKDRRIRGDTFIKESNDMQMVKHFDGNDSENIIIQEKEGPTNVHDEPLLVEIENTNTAIAISNTESTAKDVPVSAENNRDSNWRRCHILAPKVISVMVDNKYA